jgi:hypothetical protein
MIRTRRAIAAGCVCSSSAIHLAYHTAPGLARVQAARGLDAGAGQGYMFLLPVSQPAAGQQVIESNSLISLVGALLPRFLESTWEAPSESAALHQEIILPPACPRAAPARRRRSWRARDPLRRLHQTRASDLPTDSPAPEVNPVHDHLAVLEHDRVVLFVRNILFFGDFLRPIENPGETSALPVDLSSGQHGVSNTGVGVASVASPSITVAPVCLGQSLGGSLPKKGPWVPVPRGSNGPTPSQPRPGSQPPAARQSPAACR